MPWQQVDVNLIGPWPVHTRTGRTYHFNALTCIDRVTDLPELIRINSKNSDHVAAKFEECIGMEARFEGMTMLHSCWSLYSRQS